ncbi:glycosyltransferase family 4 protein [bacterium]|nr:glycosyltransferase family 4 protein [candidate division CSSED10-310 bacterium]
MRLGFDGRFIKSRRTGVGWYAANLLSHLAVERGEDELTAFVVPPPDSLPEGIITKDAVDYERHPAGDLWEQVVLPVLLKRLGIQVFHSPGVYLPACSPGCSRVVTVHDMAVFRSPEWFPAKFRRYFRLAVRLALFRAHRIIAVSAFTKSEIAALFPALVTPVDVIHHGIDACFVARAETDERERLRARYGLADSYLLAVGTLEPRKNLVNVLAAFAGMEPAFQPARLVVVGTRGWLTGEIDRALAAPGLRDRVMLLGYVTKEDLALLYRHAAGLLYPSLYEGFGMPITEAMAAGCPVITSNGSGCAEVAGEAALLVNPLDPAAIASACTKLMKEPGLAGELAQAGIERVKSFSWHRTAEETIAVYHTIAEIRGCR